MIFLIALEDQIIDIFTNHVQMVKKPTLIFGSLIDHVYIINTTVGNIYFSDRDTAQIVIDYSNFVSEIVP